MLAGIQRQSKGGLVFVYQLIDKKDSGRSPKTRHRDLASAKVDAYLDLVERGEEEEPALVAIDQAVEAPYVWVPVSLRHQIRIFEEN